MTIVVRCSCGRTLRAPDQMAGKSAHCVCGEAVPLPTEDEDLIDEVEPDFGRPIQELSLPPAVQRRPTEKKPGESVFRKSLGQNVETGELEPAVPVAPPRKGKKKKRRHDKASAAERKRRRAQDTFFSGIIRSLKFPCRWESIMTIVMMAVAYGMFTSVAKFMPYGILGFKAIVMMGLATLVILGYFLYFLFQIFRLASIDEDDLPLTLEFDIDQIRQDLWLWGGAIWWCGLPYLAYSLTVARNHEFPYQFQVFCGVLGICGAMLPMGLMSTALHMSSWDANPLLVGRAIWLTVWDYLSTTFVFGILLGVTAYAGWRVPSFPESIPIVSHIGIWLVMFYVLAAAAYGYGNFYFRNRQKLGWFGELPRQL